MLNKGVGTDSIDDGGAGDEEAVLRLEKEKEARLTLGKVPERMAEYPDYRCTILTGIRACGLRRKDAFKFIKLLDVSRQVSVYDGSDSDEVMGLDNQLFDQVMKGLA